jgi:ligand-binding sensor domain-containing protein
MEQQSPDQSSQDFLALMVALAVMLAGFICLKLFTATPVSTGTGKETKTAILVTDTVQKHVDAVIGTPRGAIVAAGDRPLSLLDAAKPTSPGMTVAENPGKFTALLLSDFALWVATEAADGTSGLLQVHDLGQPALGTIRVALPGATPPRVTALAAGLGRLWVGTNDGLLSYDWSGWKQHTPPTRFRSAATPKDIRALYLDGRGILWIGTSSGLFAFNGTEAFHYTTSQGLPGDAITVITGDAEGTLYCGTESGLATLRGETWVRHSMISERITALLVSDEGLWVGTTSELFHHMEGKWEPMSKIITLPAGGVTSLAYGPDALYVGTDQGLYRLPLTHTKPEPKPEEPQRTLVPVPASSTVPPPALIPSPKK